MTTQRFHTVIGSAFLLATLAAFGVTAEPPSGGIVCPDSAEAGELIVAESAVAGSWTVLPDSWNGCYRVDSDGTKLYFASPIAGDVYIVHASQGDAAPLISTHHLANGTAPGPGPSPTPPPVPPISDFADFVMREASKVNRPSEAEARAVIFERIADGIDAGDYSDPVAVREAANADIERGFPQSSDIAWSEYQERVGERMAAMNLETLSDYSAMFREMVDGLRRSIP